VATALLALLTLPAWAQQEPVPDHAVGVVYHDRNRDGVRGADEEGIAGVGVSNGRDVAVTDGNGWWRLPAPGECEFFVIKPRGWTSPLDRDNHPTFYYLHRPKGSGKTQFPGIAPTGPLPAMVNFPLIPHDEPGRFQAIFFGDTQVPDQRYIEYLAHDILDGLSPSSAAVGFTLGDNAANNLVVHEPLKAAIGAVGIPWYYTLGNHDENYDVPGDRQANESFIRVFGPATYSLNWGPVHFIVLDDVLLDPGKDYHAELTADQLAFVEQDLALVPQDALVVYLAHIPVDEVRNRAALFAILAKRPHVFGIAGHTHTQYHLFLGATQGWPGPAPQHYLVNGTACGSWWAGLPDETGIPSSTMQDGTPNGYSVVTFDGSGYSVEFRAARRAADDQVGIAAPETIRSEEAADTAVFVNVYAGSERSGVEMRLTPDSPWLPMQRATQPDPAYVRMAEATQSAQAPYHPLPGATTCLHLWTAPLPAHPSAGVHRIEVQTTDIFGHTYTASRVIWVK
jgi:hypothetical protein